MKFTNARVYKLDHVPEREPEPYYMIDNPDWVAHIECDGARFHVLSYHLLSDGRKCVRCSCENCIVNYLQEWGHDT